MGLAKSAFFVYWVLLRIVDSKETHKFSTSLQAEKVLHDVLLNGYNRDVRPISDESHAVVVHFGMKIHKLVKLDVRSQVLKINAFTMLRWRDPQLSWNPLDYNNITSINVFTDLIWTPDVVLYNTADELSWSHTDLYKTKAFIHNDGKLVWTAPITWKISCELDITWFPMDIQHCNITFGSWSYSRKQVVLKFYERPTETGHLKSSQLHVDSGEWNVDSLTSHEEDIIFDCCDEAFSVIKYDIELSRISLYYFMYVILPLISLSFLFLLIFHIPHDSGERMGFGVTILLSITVYLLVISEKLPEKSDDSPMLGVSFILVFLLLCAALGCACVTTSLGRKTTQPPAILLRIIDNRTCTSKKKEETNPLHNVNNFHGTVVEYELTENQPTPPITDDYAAKWVEICQYLDRRLFVLFNFLLVLLPSMILVNLPGSPKKR